MNYKPLTREEMISVIEGKGCAPRIPVLLKFWTHPEEFGDGKEKVYEIMNQYPEDAQFIPFNTPEVFKAPKDAPSYRWVNYDDPYTGTSVGLDARAAIKDWNQLDEILKDFPDPYYPGLINSNPADDGRYRIGYWWYGLFERHWQLRGMEDALCDYYDYPDEVHRLFRAVTDFYLVMIERGKRELNLDAIFFGDDLGGQVSPFLSPALFREFIKPYYNEIINKAHSLNMHVWLHCCGNIEILIPDLIEIGLDVLHPIQKHTMDRKKIADKFGNDICIWIGFDVQRVIPFGTCAEVREEVREMMDTFFRPEGRLLFTAGNGINGDCRLDALEALYDEAFSYGSVVGKK